MLPKDLLDVRRRAPSIRPVYRDPEAHRSLAADVLEAFQPDRTRGAVDERVAALETHETFKFVRGLAELVWRAAGVEVRSPVSPPDLREAAFEDGYVTTEAERERVLGAVAERFEITRDAVERGLWADREEREVLVSVPDLEPEALIRSYNRSLTQTLLFDATSVTISVSNNYQAIFSTVKRLGLMYDVDEELAITVTGPASVFARTRTYGTSLARLVPQVMAADGWALAADIETQVGGETREYRFSIDADEAELFPEEMAVETYDSDLERDIATRLDAVADGWTVTREPTILRAGKRVMIPDFSIERERGGDVACYLEVIGFWTPDYLAHKREKVRALEADHPVVLAVDASLACGAEDFSGEAVDAVVTFTDAIPVKPILDRLHAIDERYVERDLERLSGGEVSIDVPTENVVAIRELADRDHLEPAAVRRYLEETAPGVLSNDRYVPPATIAAIEAAVGSLEAPMVADVTPILDRYGVGLAALEAAGYAVNFTTLDAQQAPVRPME